MQEQCQAIGETAGKIYRVLEKGSAMEAGSLQKEINVPDSVLFNQALGWLAREDKIDFRKKGETWTVSLASTPVGQER
jgi:hypothetical protein